MLRYFQGMDIMFFSDSNRNIGLFVTYDASKAINQEVREIHRAIQ